MIPGLIPLELHEKLLDMKNYQNRTKGVEELKHVLSQVDLKLVPSCSIEKFINLLPQLLDDINFKVLCGTLQVFNLFIQKLGADVEIYLKQIVSVGLKALGDTRTTAKNENMSVFQKLIKAVAPQKILDLVIGSLKHKNSRVREDVLNIIMAAMLAHPQWDFDVPKLWFEVVPCLTDSKRRVRHAALELFVVFDHCLDRGKRQFLMKAVDMIEHFEDAEGLKAAVHARRARCILPKLSSEGIIQYGLVLPRPEDWCIPQFDVGADLDWVMNGGRISSAKSHRTEPDRTRLPGFGSLGCLTNDFPVQRKIVSAGKGTNKLIWEMSDFSSFENDQHCSNGKCSEQVANEVYLSSWRRLNSDNNGFKSPKLESSRSEATPMRLRRSGSLNLDRDNFKTSNDIDAEIGSTESTKPESSRGQVTPVRLRRSGSLNLDLGNCKTYSGTDVEIVSTESSKPESSRSQVTPACLRRSGSFNLDPDNFKTSAREIVAPKGHALSRNLGVAQTFNLSSKSTAPGCFLLPSYPLATLTGSSRTPTPPHGHADSVLSMSNTWPNKKENTSPQPATSPRRDTAGATNGNLHSGRCSPQLFRRPLMSSSPSSFRRALSNSRTTKCGLPVVPKAEQGQSNNGQRSTTLGRQLERNHPLDPDGGISVEQEPQEDDLLDVHELQNSLRSVRSSAAKKRHKLRNNSSDLDILVKLDTDMNTSHAPPMLTSSVSESGLSGLSSAPNNNISSIKTSARNSGYTGTTTHITKVSSTKLRSSVSVDFSSLQGLTQKNDRFSEVGIIGHKVTNSNGTTKTEEQMAGLLPSLVQPFVQRSGRALNSGTECQSSRCSPATDVPEGVSGRGMFSARMSSCSGVDLSCVKSNSRTNYHTDPDSYDSPHPVEHVQQRVKNGGFSHDTRWPQCLAQEESRFGQEDHTQDKTHHRVGKTPATASEEHGNVFKTDVHLNGSTWPCNKADTLTYESTNLASPPGTQSFTPPHQPRAPPVPPNTRTTTRMRRGHSIKRTVSVPPDSSDEKQDHAELPQYPDPALALTECLNLLSSGDWEKKIEGMKSMRTLAHYHPDSLKGNLPEVCVCLTEEVNNPRSVVSSFAVCTLGCLYTDLQKAMDQELEGTVRVLLSKAGHYRDFIKKDADAALDCMVQHCTPTRCINALLSAGSSHPNPLVRKSAAQHLAKLVDKVGATRLLCGTKDLTERILQAVTNFVYDRSADTRCFGRQMVLSLSSHSDFDKILENHISGEKLLTVRKLVSTLQKKGNYIPQDTQSARGKCSIPATSIVNKNEYTDQLSDLLTSKDFGRRIKGIDQLVADCQNKPNMVINSIFPVFDLFKDRLLESNSKVNQHALESLQKIIHLLKNDMFQVVNFLIPAIVDNHLNSKKNAIYSAAIGAINALILNLDNIHLLQPFCNKAHYLKGKAKVDLIEKITELVPTTYPRKPQVVKQKVLPLLWHLLCSSTHSSAKHGRNGGGLQCATTKLCQALYAQMGPELANCAETQSINAHKTLNEILQNIS